MTWTLTGHSTLGERVAARMNALTLHEQTYATYARVRAEEAARGAGSDREPADPRTPSQSVARASGRA
jgi:hypothetical protein